MALETSTKRLGVLVVDTTTGMADVVEVLRDTFPCVTADITNAAVEITIVNNLERPARLRAASWIPETTVGAAANQLGFQIVYDDGAGGAPVALTNLYSPVAAGTTAYTRLAFVQTAAMQVILIPAGSRIYVDVTVIAGGAAYNDTSFQANLRYE